MEKNIHFSTVKLLTKFVIITYAFGSVHEKFGVLWKERLSRSKLTVGVPTDSDAKTFHVLYSMH